MSDYTITMRSSEDSLTVYSSTLSQADVAPYLRSVYSVGAILISIERVSE